MFSRLPIYCCVALALSFAASAETVALPKSTGVIPVTATSKPFMAVANNVVPMDLAKLGYVEEEFILTGTANVYDWAPDGTVSVKTPNAPYGNRVLVRRPANASKFSGTVIVELNNAARRYDWSMMWGYGREYWLEHGDAWVGLPVPAALDSFKKFNPTRYAAISMANPTPNFASSACPGAGKGGPSAIEDGLRWDFYAQVAAALKSNAAGMPMAGMKVQRVFLTTQAVDITTYINAFHDRLRLEGGKPTYDGYLVRNPPAPSKTNQCAPAIAANDPRRAIKDIDVPVISVAAQGEVVDNRVGRKADSDDPKGRYRLYEIAGAAHIETFAYAGLPSFEEQNALGLAQGTPEWPFALKCEPEIQLSVHPLLKYSFHGAYRNLDQWVAKGVSPPKAPRLETKEDGTLAMDQFGHALGGVRSPWVEAPLATYTTSVPGQGTCRELGNRLPFDAAKVKGLYPTQKDYVSKVNASVDKAVKAGFFTPTDGKTMKADLAKEFAGK